MIHNLTVFENNLNVKADARTKEYLDEWAAQKEQEWIARATLLGTYDSAEIAVLKARNEILPHERLLIPSYDIIVAEIVEALRDSGSILNKELNFIGGIEQSKAREEELAETLLKFKANDREVERERRNAAMERDRESKYAKKLADWLDREASK